MNTNITKLFKAARRVSTPLITIQTPDQAVTVQTICAAVKNGTQPAVLAWDCIRGIQWANDPGLQVCWAVVLQKSTEPLPTRPDDLDRARRDLAAQSSDIVMALDMATGFPEGTVLILHNAHLWWEKEAVQQAAWNLRDAYKANQRTLVMLTDGSATIPSVLRDALPLVEALPTLDELDQIVRDQFEAVGLADDPALRAAAVDAVCGLPAFGAEQVVAMSFVKVGGKVTLDTEGLWERKRQLIEQTPGLSVWRGSDTFAEIGGLENIKEFMLSVLSGENPPRVIVFMDEIEKAFAGASGEGGGDSSGTTQEMHGTLLSEMQNREYFGAIIVGPPGTGKSALAKALAGEAKRPCVILDLSAMKSKYVGSSNENLSKALQVIASISQGQALFIATCNAVAQLPPELKRRFTLGTFFMDLPSAEER